MIIRGLRVGASRDEILPRSLDPRFRGLVRRRATHCRGPGRFHDPQRRGYDDYPFVDRSN